MRKHRGKQKDLFQADHSHAKEMYITYANGTTRALHFPFTLLDIASLQNAVNVSIVDSDYKRILFIGAQPR